MAYNIRKFFNGIKLVPKSSSTIDALGEFEVLSSISKSQFHNGTSASPLVTEAHTATLSNKTLSSPIIQTSTADTITGIAGGTFLLQSASNQNLSLQAQGSGNLLLESLTLNTNTLTGGAATFIIQSANNQDLQLLAQGIGSVLIENIQIGSNIIQGQAGNDLILRSLPTQDLYLDGGDDIIFRAGLSLTEYGSITDAGKFTIGQSLSVQDHLIQGANLTLQRAASGETFGLYRNEATGALGLSGGTSLSNGGVLRAFGASNSLYPNGLLISNAGTDYHLFHGSGNVVLGSTSTNGRDRLQINGSLSIQRTDDATVGNIISLTGTGFIKLTGVGGKDLHGINATQYSADNIDSGIISIYNGSSGDLTVKHQSATDPTAGNRIITPTGLDLIIPQGSFVQCRYDGNQNRWVVEQSSSGASGYVQGISTISSNYTLGLTDEVILVNASGGSIDIDLPQALLSPRKKYTIKKISNDDNFITIQTSGELIDDNDVYTMYYQYDSVTLVSNGTNWYLV